MTIDKLPSRYQYLNKKFSGGLGDVYLCRDRNLERKVAIKFIQNKTFLSLMHEEIKALQTVRSKHVVEIYDLIISDKSKDIGLVQEFIPGDDLTTLVRTAGKKTSEVSPAEFLKIMYQVASGIQDIHAVPIIHRDIKLNNMKLSGEGVVKLFDFGFAKSAEPNAETNGFKGTYGFAAPELYSMPAKIRKSADVYAVGICAWFLATGTLPPELKSVPPTAMKSSLATLRPDIPTRVCALLDRCLAFDPKDRPTIGRLQERIGSYLVQGKHRGVLSSSTVRYVLDDTKKALNVTMGALGHVKISYSGLDFTVEVKSGDVYLNNNKIIGSATLPGASVLVFGAEHMRAARQVLTFDVSRPEVVL